MVRDSERSVEEVGHREYDGRALSTVGIGTYLGDPNDETDEMYREAIKKGVEMGCNVVDTAINYRHQRSERVVGEAINGAAVDRDDVFVSTKGGYIAFDGEMPDDPNAYLEDEYIEPGVISREDIVSQGHCMTPDYINNQIDRSLKNLGFDYIDLYYVHNPETQLSEVPKDVFYDRLEEVFEILEERVEEGDISGYGLATWDGFRVGKRNPKHLSMESVFETAEDASDGDPSLNAVQIPYNARMDEAHFTETQEVEGEKVSALEAAAQLGLYVFSSASIMQGKLVGADIDVGRGSYSDAQKAIEFARSAPGMGTSLVGSKSVEHVEENLYLLENDPISPKEYRDLFTK